MSKTHTNDLGNDRVGANDLDSANAILGGCTALLAVIALIATAAFQLTKGPMLLIFGASSNTIGFATDYLQIYLWGTIFVQISLGLNNFIATQGFPAVSMATVLIGAALNIVLDPLFIFVFDMGVKGAACPRRYPPSGSCGFLPVSAPSCTFSAGI